VLWRGEVEREKFSRGRTPHVRTVHSDWQGATLQLVFSASRKFGKGMVSTRAEYVAETGKADSQNDSRFSRLNRQNRPGQEQA